MSENVAKALDFFLMVAAYGASWFVAWFAFMSVIAKYRKDKKDADKEKARTDAIIVKRAELTEELRIQEKEKEQLSKDIEALKVEKQQMQDAVDQAKPTKVDNEPSDENSSADNVPDITASDEIKPIDYDKKSVKELRAIAASLGMRGYSRLSKEDLVNKLRT